MSTPPQTTVVSVQLTTEERNRLEAASELDRTSLSDYIRRKSLEAADLILMDRRVVTIPTEHWQEFEIWLDRPPERKPALRELMRVEATWET